MRTSTLLATAGGTSSLVLVVWLVYGAYLGAATGASTHLITLKEQISTCALQEARVDLPPNTAPVSPEDCKKATAEGKALARLGH